jgi:DNA-binding NtrC family response regulator
MDENAHILIVDDNISVLNSLELFLKQHFQQVTAIKSPNQLESLLRRKKFDLILLDMNFSAGVSTGNEGIYWLRKIREIDNSIAVVLITAYGDIELAVNAIREGAIDFILKPWDNKKLISTINAALRLKFSEDEIRLLKNQHERISEDADRNYDFFTGDSEKMAELDKTITKVSVTDASVLIFGENGTGKEVIAREIHKRSLRKSKVMISVDLGSLTPTLFESEMFGHVKGAFTDARENRTGRFELASGSTLFLDEIGNLSQGLQSKLLTVLENSRIIPVGSNKEITVDIRLITATNKDLRQMIKEGMFREDLFFRLNTILIEVPPLRERPESIIPLAQRFLKKFSEKYEKKNISLHKNAIERLTDYAWPGNIRELKHTIEKTVILCSNNIILPEDLHLKETLRLQQSITDTLSLEEGEKMIISEALKRCNWNITEVANVLKVGRQTLYRKIRKYGL